jgi:hypothetical protein
VSTRILEMHKHSIAIPVLQKVELGWEKERTRSDPGLRKFGH